MQSTDRPTSRVLVVPYRWKLYTDGSIIRNRPMMLQSGPLHGQCMHQTCDPESTDPCSYSSHYELRFHVDGSSMPMEPSSVTTFDAVVRPSSRALPAIYSPAHFTGTRSSISMEAPYRWIYHQESSHDAIVRPTSRAMRAPQSQQHHWYRPSWLHTISMVLPRTQLYIWFHGSSDPTGITNMISIV